MLPKDFCFLTLTYVDKSHCEFIRTEDITSNLIPIRINSTMVDTYGGRVIKDKIIIRRLANGNGFKFDTNCYIVDKSYVSVVAIVMFKIIPRLN